MTADYLIVGAGFSGCVLAERIATQLDKTVLVIDRRDHIAGNAHDYIDEHGVLVHKYGPHAFHTNALSVWEYLSQFTEWRKYEHHVQASVDGRLIPVPFNLNSLRLTFRDHRRCEEALVAAYGYGSSVPILKLRESTHPELREIADFVYQKIYYGYTVKQWGLEPEQLDPSVTSRVPVVISNDNRYFHDVYQAIPRDGYTAMFKRLVTHKNIRVSLSTEFRDVVDQVRHRRLIFTGPIDEFFGHAFGSLPYRSLRFDFRSLNAERIQEVAQINYPNEHSYTRTTEFVHMTGQRHHPTTIAYEYPEAYLIGRNEPYYPIRRPENDALYQKYLDETKRLGDEVTFVGRLADYKYYNMDQIVARALRVFEERIAK